jgi:hypothetical protein
LSDDDNHPEFEDHMCYVDYNHSMTDLLGDDVPLEFDVPMPSGTGTPVFQVAASGAGMMAQSAATFVGGAQPHFHVSIPATAMPAGPITIPFEAQWANTGTAIRSFQVCLDISYNRFDDSTDSTIVDFIITGAHGLGLTDVSCQKDDTSEIVMYGALSDQTFPIPVSAPVPASLGGHGGPGTGHVCKTVTLRNDETLSISTHGYECDLSCSEHWDDSYLEASDDKIGHTHMSFTAAQNFGAPAMGQTSAYALASQPDLGTSRSRFQSPRGYQTTARITEVAVASP